MRLPNETASSWVHLVFASFSWSSLCAWAEFPDLKPTERAEIEKLSVSLKTHLDALLKEARDTQEAQLFGRPSAQAKQNATLVLLKRRIDEALALVTIRLGAGSKKHPAVLSFLPGLLTGFSRAPIDKRPKLANEAAGRLEAGEDFGERAVLVGKLKDAADRAQHAIHTNDSAQMGWSKERSEELVAKGRLRLELERIHRSLGALFPGQRDFVESFFLRGEKPSEGTGEDEAAGTNEAP
ncbi:hypothetical protein [Polyangium fumosum]|uniref:Uncharacterized protein n=1 Tax=Polyangium fumosum TaxID=889272 RepID=A0A4U1INN2_9BACT|nr:hypothetical protein [Polyangium fumosum]TKC95703.1 hypothetical protein E8A74_46780 [Polyangium fumosum]